VSAQFTVNITKSLALAATGN